MTSKDIIQAREELFNQFIDYYTQKAKLDQRYEKTVKKLQSKKEEFLNGRTLIQVLKG